MWNLPLTSTKPLYHQLVDLIEQGILNGSLIPGERLPSERQLSNLLNVNRSTVIHALNILTDRGLLIRKIGSGSYVNPSPWALQSYPLIHWHPSSSVYNQEYQDDYSLHIQKLRKETQQNHTTLFDMATGDLSPALLPSLNLTDPPWKHVLSLEQDDETSLLGLYTFRQAVQQHMQKKLGLKVNLSEILITTGTQQGLFLLAQTLLKPGDAIGVEAPSSFYRLPIFQASGLRVRTIAMDQHGVIPESLIKIIKKHPLKMLFLNPFFQNPTGSVLSLCRQKEILQLCYENQIPLIEDDAYSLLSFNSEIDCHPLKGLDTRHHVIYLGSLSKYIGKTVRVGWIIAPKPIIKQLANVRRQIDGGISVLPQLLAQYYLSHQIDSHTTWLRQILSEKANHLYHWLDKNYKDLLKLQKPQGGLYLYTKCRAGKIKLLEQQLKHWLDEKIIVAKGEVFGGEKGDLRFNFSHFIE